MGKKKADQRPGLFVSMLDSFLTYIIEARGMSENTKTAYKVAFRNLITFFLEVKHVNSGDITFAMLDMATVEEYLKWLEVSKNNSVSTRNNRLAAIRSFARYAANHDFEAASRFEHTVSRIDLKKGLPLERSYFTIDEVKILIDLPKLNTNAGRRDATILPFMFASGCRAQEICDLHVKDIQFLSDGRARITLHGKGNKSRKISIAAQVSALLKKYIKFRRVLDVPDAYVFITQNNPQMSVSCLESIYKKYVDIARKEHPTMFQEKSYTPHSMRHTTAVSMLAAGVPLPVIKVFLGHNHISTTEIYARITQPSMEDALIAWNKSFWGHVEQDYVEEDKDNATQEHPVDSNMPSFLL